MLSLTKERATSTKEVQGPPAPPILGCHITSCCDQIVQFPRGPFVTTARMIAVMPWNHDNVTATTVHVQQTSWF